MSHLYSFTLYWKNNVKEIVEIQNAHSMVYSITSMHESFYVMNIFLNYSHFLDNYISIFNIINEYIVTGIMQVIIIYQQIMTGLSEIHIERFKFDFHYHYLIWQLHPIV